MIEANEETLLYTEEDWQDPEQIEVPKNLEADLPFAIQTRQSDRTRLTKMYNPYGDDFVVDRIDLKKTKIGGSRGNNCVTGHRHRRRPLRGMDRGQKVCTGSQV